MVPKLVFRSTLLALSCAGVLGAAAGGCKPLGGVDVRAGTARGATARPGEATAVAPPGSGVAATSTAAAGSAAAARHSGPPDANMSRADIPADFKWKLDAIFPDDAAFESAFAGVAEGRQRLASFKGKLQKPSELRACLDVYFQTRLATNRLTLYANLRQDSDQKSSKLQGMQQRALDAMQALIEGASFIRSEVLALADPAVTAAYKAEPKLAQYKPYLDELRRRRKHVLGSEAERVLNLAGDNLWAEIDLNELPSDVEKIFKSIRAELTLPTIQDEHGQPVQLTLANYNKYRASGDRRVRKDAVEGLFGALRRNQNSFAAALGGQIRLNVFMARARGYDTALDAYLNKDNIDPAVYRNLVSTIDANLAPLHRYVALRKKLMGVPELHVYDLYAPMIESARRTVSYSEALQILPQALAPLGDEYLAALRTGIDPKNGWIDVYPHKDKDSGAFSVGVFGIHPYVKLNYLDSLEDLSTMAHECGHAMHSYLSNKTQPYVTSNYVISLAEIASTTNEKLLADWLLDRAKSDQEKLDVLNKLVESIRTTIYRQTMFAEFELLAHTAAEKGTPLTAEFFDKTYTDLVRRYYGPDLTVGENDGLEWAYVPHFYYKYYTYSYANGLSAGIAIAERVKHGGAAERDAYLNMLRGGDSKPPLELLRGAGVDLTKPDAIVAAAKLMDQTVAQLEAILLKGKH
jgi:oligoendopeptidase F